MLVLTGRGSVQILTGRGGGGGSVLVLTGRGSVQILTGRGVVEGVC